MNNQIISCLLLATSESKQLYIPENVTNTPIFGIILCIAAFEIGLICQRKTKISILNPLLIANIITIGFLLIFNIPHEQFMLGGKIIDMMLGPAVVVMAVPLYHQLKLLKKNFFAIISGVISGCISTFVMVHLLCLTFKLDHKLAISIFPKSISTPFGLEVCKSIEGMEAITVLCIIITGITGAVLAPILCNIFRLKDKIAIGIAIGSSSHAIGTSKALEMGEEEGAMSTLAIGITGITTVILLPIYLKFLF